MAVELVLSGQQVIKTIRGRIRLVSVPEVGFRRYQAAADSRRWRIVVP